MLNLNPTTLQAVTDQALIDAAAHPRWITAIGRAVNELDTNPWLERGELHGLVIGSPSGNVYAANGTCQCQAYQHGNACWHRAAARLVRLHDEALERVTKSAAPPTLSPVGDTPLGQRPLVMFARQDAETARLAAKGELRAEIEAQQLARKIAAARATALLNELFT